MDMAILNRAVLTINSGSSSIKASMFSFDGSRSNFRYEHLHEHEEAFNQLMSDLGSNKPDIVGHRFVHGGDIVEPARLINAAERARIEGLIHLAPLHLPGNLLGLYMCLKHFDVPQVACFDTAFHAAMPDISRRLPIPDELGLQRFGFHGISHKHASERAGGEKIISCHLGGGSSITAIKNGKAIDTSMGFTPLEGLTMMSRCGDLDPGIVLELARTLSPEKTEAILNHESGLKGICGLTDMKEILKKADEKDKKAILALKIFIYRIQKYIGAYYAILGGCDTLVFTGAIGAGSLKIRQLICGGLAILNKPNKVKILTVRPNEELAIAEEVKKYEI